MGIVEIKRIKAKNLRYKKPIAKDLNLASIQEALWTILEECADVQYYVDGEDDTLLNALDGDEDDAYEFKMMFSDLTTDCERMQMDLENEYIPDCFDLFFVAIGKDQDMLGYDTYEQDYYGLSSFESRITNEEAVKKLKTLTKDQLIEAAQSCFKIYQAYIGLQYRYDCIKAAMDILRDENTGYLQMVKQIDNLYEKVNEETEGFRFHFGVTDAVREFDQLLKNMPQEVWI